MQIAANRKSGFFEQLADAYEAVKETPIFRPQWIVLDLLIIAAALLI
ncbi:hypothetical protein BcepF1.120 [Burkholderia phage BcepF1]|uniref:Uncharacterized protein n=1 Tax=Burkholderia phage BcepF1 TaxID=2886897 RepID=A1Z024_9CAUD|nr:hypothetical protein BcepF1.120 [Burkholderia phage BcepF1]ABL96851.1 hypothetical protein BcepF1.120 [Burkholderia phage BcepF1]